MAQSSRIILKNVPKQATEARIRDIFGKHGSITQVKLLPKRNLCYIGYKTSQSAEKAVTFHHDTYIDTSKIEVSLALRVGDKDLPRPWSKKSQGSSAFEDNQQARRKLVAKLAAANGEGDQDEGKKKKDKKKKKKSIVEEQKLKLKQLQDLEADPGKNPELAEFMEVMGLKAKATWSNDAIMSTEARSKKGGDSTKAPASTFEDGGSSDEEYEDMPTSKGKVAPTADSSDDDADSEEEADPEQANKTATTSNSDWLKSKMSTAADEEDDANDKADKAEGEAADSDDSSDDDSDDDSDDSDDSDDNEAPEPVVLGTTEKYFTVRLLGLPFKAKEAEIVRFFHPIVPVDIRLLLTPRNKRPTGRAFVDFKSKEDWHQALRKHGEKMGKRYIEVTAATPDQNAVQILARLDAESSQPVKNYSNPLGQDDEEMGESGRLYCRNLPYSCTEDDLRQQFEAFGPLSELHMPIDANSKKPKGFAFITFVMPEHATKAFSKLDGNIFQGRLLHILPARGKPGSKDVYEVEERSFKKNKDKQQKTNGDSTYNWNTLFLRQDTVASAMADELGVSKGDVLNADADGSLAVRMALGETNIIADNKAFLAEHGVRLSAFDTRVTSRSRTVILAKNLPFNTNLQSLKPLFERHGTILSFVLPPSKTIALIHFLEPSEARKAFRGLAYRKYQDEPLYLEWAPDNCFVKDDNDPVQDDDMDEEPDTVEAAAPSQIKSNKAVEETEETDDLDADATEAVPSGKTAKRDATEVLRGVDSDDEQDDGEPTSTLFVKNLNFETPEETLRNAFEGIGPLRSVTVATKRNPHQPDEVLSMGFGFVEFKKRSDAVKALKRLQGMVLDEHELSLKMSNKTGKAQTVKEKKGKKIKAKSNKLLVRNVAFEATRKELQELFSTHGTIASIRMPRKAYDGTHRGFAFVEYSTKQEARNAFQALSSTHLYGRRLAIEFAEDDQSVEAMRAKTSRDFAQNDSRSRRDRSKRVKFDD